jgi:hypothetical protein
VISKNFIIVNKSIFTFLLFLFSVSAFAQHTKKDLLGRWEGTDEKNITASLTFLDSTKVVLTTQGSYVPPFNYVVDLTKNPGTIDLIVVTKDGRKITMKGLIQFLNDDTVKWQMFPDGKRRANFDEKLHDSAIVLKRVKT